MKRQLEEHVGPRSYDQERVFVQLLSRVPEAGHTVRAEPRGRPTTSVALRPGLLGARAHSSCAKPNQPHHRLELRLQKLTVASYKQLKSHLAISFKNRLLRFQIAEGWVALFTADCVLRRALSRQANHRSEGRPLANHGTAGVCCRSVHQGEKHLSFNVDYE